jgi:hypothetical protein
VIFPISRIYVKDLLVEGVDNGSAELRPRKYSVVRADNSYCGEIEVGLTFTRKVNHFEVYSLKVLIFLVLQIIAKIVTLSSQI